MRIRRLGGFARRLDLDSENSSILLVSQLTRNETVSFATSVAGEPILLARRARS
jgi:hypothetical protein